LALEFRREELSIREPILVQHAHEVVPGLTLIVGILPIDPRLQQRNRLRSATGAREMGVKDTDDALGFRYAIALRFVPQPFFQLGREIDTKRHDFLIAPSAAL
jgi:hypothetical protein